MLAALFYDSRSILLPRIATRPLCSPLLAEFRLTLAMYSSL
jgi:hypothetical protein